MQTQAQSTAQPPAIAAVITHELDNFERWQHAFDAHAAARRAAGIVATHINRHVDNPKRVSVYLAGSSADALQGFLTSQTLIETMREAGVSSVPHVAMVAPVEDMTVKDRALAGVIVRHQVPDFAIWKHAFDADASARAQAGIIGHAVNRSAQNPNFVVVYLQAESLDALRAFSASPVLKQVMQTAGVMGVPELDFVQGSEWAA